MKIYQTKKDFQGIGQLILILNHPELAVVNNNIWLLKLRVTKNWRLFYQDHYNLAFEKSGHDYSRIITRLYHKIRTETIQDELIEINPKQLLTHPLIEVRDYVKGRK